MKRLVVILACLSCFPAASGQNLPDRSGHNDSLILSIPAGQTHAAGDIARFITSGFDTERDRVRAIYVWITENIAYDVADTSPTAPWGAPSNIVKYTLAHRKGVCDNYSALFAELCARTGIEARMIGGYVKQDGAIQDTPHSWNAARIDSHWYLFDPTWGAGHGAEDGTFARRPNDDYFMLEPQTMILTHMPFDPLWQFLDHPLTHSEFAAGLTPDNDGPCFNYADSIRRHEKLPEIGKLAAEARRISADTGTSPAVRNRLDYLELSIKLHHRRQHIAHFESAREHLARGTDNLNELVRYRKANPTLIVNTTQPILDSARENVAKAQSDLSKISSPDPDIADGISRMKQHIAESREKISDFQRWINRNK